MADIINLRLARKAAKRTASERQAETNRAKFGRSRSEEERDRIEAERQARLIDGARLDSSGREDDR